MLLKIGIVGLSQSGKTTFFRILTKAHGSGAGSSRAETHLGMVSVPDHRLERLSEMFQPRKTVFANVEYADTAGSVIDVVRSGPQSAALREVQALALVVRAFGEDAGLAVVQRDIENVELELVLSDLGVAEKRLERLEKDVKKQKSAALEQELEALKVCKETLEKQTPLREISLSQQQERAVRGFTFLSVKPMLIILNLDEKDAARADAAEVFSGAHG
ncbi:MAG: redox-regulated ATPase YchF, partial [Terriglobia bacterium]